MDRLWDRLGSRLGASWLGGLLGLLDGFEGFGGLGGGGINSASGLILHARYLLETLTLEETGHRDLGRDCLLATEPLGRRHSWGQASGRGVNIVLEVLRPTGNDEGNRLNVRVIHGLISASHFVLVHVHTTLWHEGNTSLRVARLVLRKELELVVLELEVTDVAVTSSRQIQAVGAVIPEGHAY